MHARWPARVTVQGWFSNGQLSVLGTGSALPGASVSNAELIERVRVFDPELNARSAERLGKRLGISTRHLSRSFDAAIEAPSPGNSNPEISAQALTAALAEAGLSPNDLGYIIGHTASPAQPLPGNIALVADLVGFDGPHIELRQACTGFANALMIAFGLLATVDSCPVAIIGSETGSLFFDPRTVSSNASQRVNMMQMGDAAAAIVLGPAGSGSAMLSRAWFGTTGHGRPPGIEMREGGSNAPRPCASIAHFRQDFAAIGRSGPGLFAACAAAAQRQSLSIAGANHIIPHQANGRMDTVMAELLGVSAPRIFVNAGRVGNTGSAAIWLALAELRASGLAAGSQVVVLGAEATKYLHGGFAYVH